MEGHHLSFNFTIVGGKVAATTPLFMGANPHEVRQGPRAGLRPLGAEEDLGRELLAALDEGRRAKAIIGKEAPEDIFTRADRKASIEGPPQGHVEIRAPTETLWRDSNDGEGLAVEPNRAAEDPLVAAELAAPEAVAQDDHWRRLAVRRRLRHGERSTARHSYAVVLEDVARELPRHDVNRQISAGHRHVPGSHRNCTVQRAQLLEFGKLPPL